MSSRQLAKNTLLYTFSPLFQKGIAFLVYPILTRTLEPSEYGVVDILITLINFTALLLSLGLSGGILRDSYNAQSEEERVTIYSTGFWYDIFATTTGCILGMLLAQWLKPILFGTNQTYYLPLLLGFIIIPFTRINRNAINLLQFRQMAKENLQLVIPQIFLNAVLMLAFVVWLQLGVLGYILAGLILNAVFSVVGIWKVRRFLAFFFSLRIFKSLLKTGIPNLIGLLSFYLITYSDRYLLLYLTDAGKVGIYGAAFRIERLSVLVIAGFTMAWMPYAFSIKDNENSPQRFANLSTPIIFGILLALSPFGIFAREIMAILAPESYSEATFIIPIMIFATAIYVLADHFFVLGISFYKPFHRWWITSVALVVNVALNVILIPYFDIYAAAFATLAAYIVWAILHLTVSTRLYYIPFRLGKLLLMYLLFGGVLYFSTFFYKAWAYILLKIAIVIVFPVCVVLMRIIRLREVKTIFMLIYERARRKTVSN